MVLLVRQQQCDRGNRTLNWSQFCDGIIDCFDRTDEEGHFCKLCLNNLYSCPPQDDIRCDLACQILGYVPCQTIQDRRACDILQRKYEKQSIFQLVQEFQSYIIVCISILLLLIGLFLLFKCFQQRISISSSSKLSTETDTLSSHIYEECYETIPEKYSYYEHVV